MWTGGNTRTRAGTPVYIDETVRCRLTVPYDGILFHMGYRRVPFQRDEWFHCYSRGIDKRIVFESEKDAERFLQLLYLANSTGPVRLDDLSNKTEDIVTHHRPATIVSIGAYCFMPNHYHLLLKEIVDGGISLFMQKLGTAYSMYFNAKNKRIGNVFVKPFRSRHVGEDRYFQHVVNYIHCNPVEMFEPGWKKGVVRDLRRLEHRLRQYRYSSFPDYAGERRAIATILSKDGFDVFNNTSPKKMLADAKTYYSSAAIDDVDFS